MVRFVVISRIKSTNLSSAPTGAGLYTAGLSRAYRAKEYRIFDSTPYDIQSAYASEKASDSAKPPRTIHTTLFGPGARLGTKKTLSMKRTEDFDLRLEYKSAPVA